MFNMTKLTSSSNDKEKRKRGIEILENWIRELEQQDHDQTNSLNRNCCKNETMSNEFSSTIVRQGFLRNSNNKEDR